MPIVFVASNPACQTIGFDAASFFDSVDASAFGFDPEDSSAFDVEDEEEDNPSKSHNDLPCELSGSEDACPDPSTSCDVDT